jgi:alkane 1-monooxygenase
MTFWLTGPHSWWVSLLWVLPIVALVAIDNNAPVDHRQPREDVPAWPYNIQVYLLFAIQMTNHVLCCLTASKLHVDTWAGIAQAAAMLIPTMVLSGVNAGYSGIVVSHELIHRRNPLEFTMGRFLLGAVLYEHFSTEHIRGHHPRIGTAEDPATARFGETHKEFLRRTIPAQFKSAWHLEKVRNQLEGAAWYSPRWLNHRVLQGVVAQAVTLGAIGYFFGFIALFFFFMQARTAIFMLETVNYIEHWGLQRTTKKVIAIDSWDSDNYFTLYTLVGLSRHADHHAQASRPYQKLRHFDETAKMPLGYYGTIVMSAFQNAKYQELATAELMRKRLGPFRVEGTAPVSHLHPSLRPLDTDAVA